MNKEIFSLLILLVISSCGLAKLNNPSLELSEVKFDLSIRECINLDSYEVPILLTVHNMGKEEVTIDNAVFVVPSSSGLKDSKGNEIKSEVQYELTYTNTNNGVRYVKIPPDEKKTFSYGSDFFRYYKFKENEEYFIQGMYPNKKIESGWINTNKFKLVFCE